MLEGDQTKCCQKSDERQSGWLELQKRAMPSIGCRLKKAEKTSRPTSVSESRTNDLHKCRGLKIGSKSLLGIYFDGHSIAPIVRVVMLVSVLLFIKPPMIGVDMSKFYVHLHLLG